MVRGCNQISRNQIDMKCIINLELLQIGQKQDLLTEQQVKRTMRTTLSPYYSRRWRLFRIVVGF
jgi:hypothetical protein